MAGKFSIEALFSGKDGVSKVIAGIEGRTSRFTSSFAKGLKEIGETNSKIISGLAEFAKKTAVVGAAIGVGLGAGLYEVMKTTNEVADGQARLATVMTKTAGFSEGASARMKEAALDWADVHKTTAVEFEKSAYTMVSAGLNEEQALAGSRTSALVAAATFGDASEAAKALATQYNVLGDKTKPVTAEMGRLGDVMTRTQQVFQLDNLDQLTEGLKYGTPIAKMFGQTTEELNTAMGMLNNAGIVGTSGGTAYTAMLEKMIPASKKLGFAVAHNKDGMVDFGGTLSNIHKKFGSFDKASDATKAALEEAFGRRGIVGIALMADKTAEYATNLASVNDNANAAKNGAKIIEAAGSGPIDELIHKYDHAKVALGAALTPVTGPIVERIGNVISAVIVWTKANQGLITAKVQGFIDDISNALPTVVTWLERIGKVLFVFGAFVIGIKAITFAMAAWDAVAAANPWTLLIFGLFMLTAIVIAFWPEIKKLTAAVWEHKTAIETVATILGILIFFYKGAAMWTGIVQGATWLLTAATNGYALAARAGAVASGIANMGLLPLLGTAALVILAIGAMAAAWHQFNALLDENGGLKGIAAFATGGFAGLNKELDRQAKEQAKNGGVGVDGAGVDLRATPGTDLMAMIKAAMAGAPIPGMPTLPGMPAGVAGPVPYGPPPPPGMQIP